MTLAPLYKTTATGATQVYLVSTDGPEVIVSQGQLNGKMQEYRIECSGKNIGKSNESTPTQQAEIEAKAKWTKKCKANYSTSVEAPTLVQLPMKISTFEKHGKKLNYDEGVYESPKLNGVNITIRLVDGELQYTSRGGEPRATMPHQVEDIKKAMELLGTTTLAGEMYCHRQHLQHITSAVTKHNELTPSLEFCIFDLPEMDQPYSVRAEHMSNIAELMHLLSVQVIASTRISSESEAHSLMKHYVESGYEGVVLHSASSLYKYNTRSTTSMKLKPVLDAEFVIQSMTTDKNEHPVFTCVTAEGATFKVKPKGTNAERKLIIDEYNTKYHNKWYTIEYEMLSKDGVPLKGVGIGLRDCNSAGEPLV